MTDMRKEGELNGSMRGGAAPAAGWEGRGGAGGERERAMGARGCICKSFVGEDIFCPVEVVIVHKAEHTFATLICTVLLDSA
jgi:hypothetical protein